MNNLICSSYSGSCTFCFLRDSLYCKGHGQIIIDIPISFCTTFPRCVGWYRIGLDYTWNESTNTDLESADTVSLAYISITSLFPILQEGLAGSVSIFQKLKAIGNNPQFNSLVLLTMRFFL